MKKLILNFHLYIGMAAALFLCTLALTGAFLVFEHDVDRALNANMQELQPQGKALSWDELRAIVERNNPDFAVAQINFPTRPDDSTYVLLVSSATKAKRELYVSQYTGQTLGDVANANHFAKDVDLLHTHLLAGIAGNKVVVWSTAGLLLLSISGIILWWPRKVMSVTTGNSLPRFNNDLHHTIGFWSFVAMLSFSVTGLVIHANRRPNVTPLSRTATPMHVPGRSTTIGDLVSTAGAMIPGATPTRIYLSQRAGLPDQVDLRFPEDHTPSGRSSVAFDPRTGAVLHIVSSRTAPMTFRFADMWNREIHTGDLFGWPTRILAMLFSLALAVLSITGPLMWLNKQLAKAKGRRALKRRLQLNNS